MRALEQRWFLITTYFLYCFLLSPNSMVGALNKLPIAASGMVFFGDPVTLGSVSAIGTGFFAGVVYAVAKNNQSNADKARNTQDTMIPLHQRKG